jgi:aspartate racemase
MTDRVIGIIGGMGPEATVDFYREIIRLTPAQKDQDHIPVLIYSNPRIPERTQAILHGGEDPTPYLIDAARILERAGAGILAIPCNTAHYFLPRVRPAVKIPILDMIEETFLRTRAEVGDIKAVGLLATTGTVESGVYRNIFTRHGVSILTPAVVDQDRIQQAIRQIKSDTYDRERQDTLESIGSTLIKAGAQAVILGCTEIPLAFNVARVNYPVINATRVLAQAAVDWALGKIE